MTPSRTGLAVLISIGIASWYRFGLHAGPATIPDDGYFYLVLGRNFAELGTITFDGSTFTNGFHPLWMPIVSTFADLPPDTAISALHITCLILSLSAGLILFKLLGMLRVNPATGLAMLFFYLLVLPNFGSELHLSVLLQLMGVLSLGHFHQEPSNRSALLCGLSWGLCCLARLDLVFTAAIAVLTLRRPRAMASFSAGMIITWPYLLWNYASSGHFVPISGAVKSSFPVPVDVMLVAEKLGGFGVMVNLAAIIAVWFAIRASQPLRSIWLTLAAGGLIHGVYTGLFTYWGWSQDYTYYYSSAYLALVVSGSVGANWILSRFDELPMMWREHFPWAFCTVLFLGLHLVIPQSIWHEESAYVQFARRASVDLPSNAVILTVDGPGRLAFFSERAVIALDGLTQPATFDHELRDPDVQALATRRGVTHLFSLRLEDYTAPWIRQTYEGDQTCAQSVTPASRQATGGFCVHDADILASVEQYGGRRGAVVGSLRTLDRPKRRPVHSQGAKF